MAMLGLVVVVALLLQVLHHINAVVAIRRQLLQDEEEEHKMIKRADNAALPKDMVVPRLTGQHVEEAFENARKEAGNVSFCNALLGSSCCQLCGVSVRNKRALNEPTVLPWPFRRGGRATPTVRSFRKGHIHGTP